GLLLSTHAQDGASGNHLDTTAAKSQLESSLNNAKALSEVAKNQQTDPLENLDYLKSFISDLEKDQSDESKNQADAFKQALMVLASPNSIGLSSNEDIHVSADKQISHSAGDSINLSTQKNFLVHAQNKISMFAAQEGARLYAAKDKVEIQAQGDGADLIARKGIQIISTEDRIEFIASKKIVLIADTTQIEIGDAGVLPTTPGLFEVKAGQHKFLGGAKVDNKQPELALLPDYHLTYVAKDAMGKPIANRKYVITLPSGQEISGVTDSSGRTQKVVTKGPQNISVTLEDLPEEQTNGYQISRES
ncbi:DUF2345 domain-containing protein, partial [Acinetobacter bereziniae]